MYKAIVTALEEKQKQLLRENDDLRRTMRTLQAELQDALTSHFGSSGSVCFCLSFFSFFVLWSSHFVCVLGWFGIPRAIRHAL